MTQIFACPRTTRCIHHAHSPSPWRGSGQTTSAIFKASPLASRSVPHLLRGFGFASVSLDPHITCKHFLILCVCVCVCVHLQRQDSMKLERVFSQTSTLKKRIARLVNENEVTTRIFLNWCHWSHCTDCSATVWLENVKNIESCRLDHCAPITSLTRWSSHDLAQDLKIRVETLRRSTRKFVPWCLGGGVWAGLFVYWSICQVVSEQTKIFNLVGCFN